MTTFKLVFSSPFPVRSSHRLPPGVNARSIAGRQQLGAPEFSLEDGSIQEPQGENPSPCDFPIQIPAPLAAIPDFASYETERSSCSYRGVLAPPNVLYGTDGAGKAISRLVGTGKILYHPAKYRLEISSQGGSCYSK